MDTRDEELADRLAHVADLLNEVGPESPAIDQYIQGHAGDAEFVGLARLAQQVKRHVIATASDQIRAAVPVPVG